MDITGEKTIVEYISGIEKRSIVLQEGASLKALFIVQDADLTIDVVTQGERSKATVSCVFLSKKGSKVAASVQGTLQASHSAIDLYLLSLLGEQAECNIDGGIVIAPDIVKTSGHLLEENIVLGKKVKIKTLPMLDVRSADVNASHGAKIDRLDENKLFYMMAKGLDQKQSQMLIVQGYIERLCDELHRNDDAEKEQIISQILEYLDMRSL